MEWMLDIQLGRRNLTPIQRIAVAEKYRPIYEKQALLNKQTAIQKANVENSKHNIKFDFGKFTKNQSNQHFRKTSFYRGCFRENIPYGRKGTNKGGTFECREIWN